MKKIDKIFDDLHYELITEKQAASIGFICC